MIFRKSFTKNEGLAECMFSPVHFAVFFSYGKAGSHLEKKNERVRIPFCAATLSMTTIDVLIRRSVQLQQYECVNRNIQDYKYTLCCISTHLMKIDIMHLVCPC